MVVMVVIVVDVEVGGRGWGLQGCCRLPWLGEVEGRRRRRRDKGGNCREVWAPFSLTRGRPHRPLSYQNNTHYTPTLCGCQNKFAIVGSLIDT